MPFDEQVKRGRDADDESAIDRRSAQAGAPHHATDSRSGSPVGKGGRSTRRGGRLSKPVPACRPALYGSSLGTGSTARTSLGSGRFVRTRCFSSTKDANSMIGPLSLRVAERRCDSSVFTRLLMRDAWRLGASCGAHSPSRPSRGRRRPRLCHETESLRPPGLGCRCRSRVWLRPPPTNACLRRRRQADVIRVFHPGLVSLEQSRV